MITLAVAVLVSLVITPFLRVAKGTVENSRWPNIVKRLCILFFPASQADCRGRRLGLLRSGGSEVRHSNFDHRPVLLIGGCWLFFSRRGGRSGRDLGPNAINASRPGGNSQVIANELAMAGKPLFRPVVVDKRFAAVAGTGQGEFGLDVLRIIAAIVKDDTCDSSRGIHRQPLEELVGAVVNGIGIHPYRRAPAAPAVMRSGAEDVHIAIAVVAPGDVQHAILAARVHANF